MPHDNSDRVMLFVNDKGNNPKRPDFSGFVTIAGREFKLSLWKEKNDDGSLKKDKNGNPYMTGRVRADGGGGEADDFGF